MRNVFGTKLGVNGRCLRGIDDLEGLDRLLPPFGMVTLYTVTANSAPDWWGYFFYRTREVALAPLIQADVENVANSSISDDEVSSY